MSLKTHTAQPLVIGLREHEQLPNVALSPEQAKALREHFGQYLDVRRAFAGPGYDLRPGGYAGDVVLGDLRLRIQPKVPVTNLFYMLTYAAHLAQFRDETTTLAAAGDIFEFIVAIFAQQVEALARQGIARGYVERDESAVFLRGRLRLADQLRRGIIQPGRFEQRLTEFTADLRENRILKATLARLARLEFEDSGLRPRLRRVLSAFSEVTLCDVPLEECDRVIYTRLNQRYRSPLALARLLLARLALEGSAGETTFAAFLLPMADVFEGFVSGFLAERLAVAPRLDVRSQYRYSLDQEGRLAGRPDNLLRRDGRPRLVLDTKYKVYGEKPNEADLYQMVAYCKTLDIDRALLLYPGEAAADTFRIKGNVVVETQAMSLAGSLADFRARWARWANELILTI